MGMIVMLLKYVKSAVAYALCEIQGHQFETVLKEDDCGIATKVCTRCGAIPMSHYTWKWKHIPPPDSTEEQIKEWEEYCDTKYQEIRDSVNKELKHEANLP